MAAEARDSWSLCVYCEEAVMVACAQFISLLTQAWPRAHRMVLPTGKVGLPSPLVCSKILPRHAQRLTYSQACLEADQVHRVSHRFGQKLISYVIC